MAYKFIRTAARLAVPAAMFFTLTNPSTAANVARGSVTFVDECIYNVTLDNPNSLLTIPKEGFSRITSFSVTTSCGGELHLLGDIPTGQPGIFYFDNDDSVSYRVAMRDSGWFWDSHYKMFVMYNSEANRTYRGDIMTVSNLAGYYQPKTYYYTIEVKTFAEVGGGLEDSMSPSHDDHDAEELLPKK